MKKIFFLWVVSLSVLLHGTCYAEFPDVPIEFQFGMGGYFGGNQILMIQDQQLIYKFTKPDVKSPKDGEVIKVSGRQWKEFKKSLEALHVDHWQKSYMNPAVTDGTQWALKIRYTDWSVDTSGSNSFPLADGSPNNDPEPSKTFQDFLQALKKLSAKDIH